MILIIINIVLLFLISSLLPFISFILPVYRIKTLYKLKLKVRFLVNIISTLLILLINYRHVENAIYICTALYIIEIVYFVFEKSKIQIFDRILISTVITAVIAYVSMRIFVGTSDDFIALIDKVYKQYKQLDPIMISSAINYIKLHLLSINFVGAFIINYFTYFLLKKKEYLKWKISYLWILIYIITIFMEKVLKIDNQYIKNLNLISIIMYTVYGIKVLCNIFINKLKLKSYSSFLAILVAIYFYIPIFTLGVLGSFNLIKFKKKEKIDV